MASGEKRQGVISGSIPWQGKEYVEIFDQTYKYLFGEVDDLFVAYGTWVEYEVVDAGGQHPRNCFKRAIKINMDVKRSFAPTTDEFGKKLMNVRDYNKVDYFQFDSQGDGTLTHKSTVRRNFQRNCYFNSYYGEVKLAKDSQNRLMEFNINEVDVMLTFIPSTKYSGHGPHWEVTHFIDKGKMYSINGFLSIRGFVLRGPGGVVRNRRDVIIPPDSLRPAAPTRVGSPSCCCPVGKCCCLIAPKSPMDPSPPQSPSSWNFGLAPHAPSSVLPPPAPAPLPKSILKNAPTGLSGFGMSTQNQGTTPRSPIAREPSKFLGFNPTQEALEARRKALQGKSFGGGPPPKPSSPPASSSFSDPKSSRGLGSFGISTFAAAARDPALRGFGPAAPPVSAKQEQPKPIGFGVSKGFGPSQGSSSTFGGGGRSSFGGGESLRKVEEKPHPLDESPEKVPEKKESSGNLYNDDWGDDEPTTSTFQSRPRDRRFPGGGRTGLARFSNAQF